MKMYKCVTLELLPEAVSSRLRPTLFVRRLQLGQRCSGLIEESMALISKDSESYCNSSHVHVSVSNAEAFTSTGRV